MSEGLLTTRQAAELLRVHESSIKRWCNAETMRCTFTEGGHRRIPLGDLLDFARRQELPCRLADFAPHEEAVWSGLEAARGSGDLDRLVALSYDWVEADRSELFTGLLTYCHELGLSQVALFDGLVGPLLHRIGASWQNGAIGVGDEHRMTEQVRDGLYALSRMLPTNGTAPRGVAVVGCARGEEHDLGALMIRLLLEAAHWNVVYLGARVPSEDVALQQVKHRADLVCLSLVPPLSGADARHVAQSLARFYDPAQPYRLALGGSGVRGLSADDWGPLPFADLELFDSTDAFARWLENLPVRREGKA